MLITKLLKTEDVLTIEEYLKSLNKRMMVYHEFSFGCAEGLIKWHLKSVVLRKFNSYFEYE